MTGMVSVGISTGVGALTDEDLDLVDIGVCFEAKTLAPPAVGEEMTVVGGVGRVRGVVGAAARGVSSSTIMFSLVLPVEWRLFFLKNLFLATVGVDSASLAHLAYGFSCPVIGDLLGRDMVLREDEVEAGGGGYEYQGQASTAL